MAHGAGIVHRDLKPANIRLRPDGTVKVLDFGLAKAVDGASRAGSADEAGRPSLARAPTITSPAMTAAGIVLGTAAYMSPEQARGKPVDKRTDIWAFGCVVFEMLSGQRPFTGDEVTDVIVSIVSRDPDWRLLPADCPPALQRLLIRCLAKDWNARLPDIGVARLDIDDAANAVPVGAAASSPEARRDGRRSGEWVAWACAAAGLAVAAGALGWNRQPEPAVSPPLARFVLEPPAGFYFSGAVAASPDGRRVVVRVVEHSGGNPHLWLRELDSPVGRVLAATTDASGPFWSPDSRTVGFFQTGKLRAIELGGSEASRVIADTPNPTQGIGASWGSRGTIVFSSDQPYRVPVSGGTPVPVTTLDSSRGDLRHTSPWFLPDGHRFLFVALNRDEAKSGVHIGALDSDETALIETGPFVTAYAHGFLLFGRNASLFARPFDLASGRPHGDPILVAGDIFLGASVTRMFVGVGGDILAHVDSAGAAAPMQLRWFARDGSPVGPFGQPTSVHSLWLTNDDQRVVIERPSYATGMQGADLWILDGRSGTTSRFTTDPATEGHPVVSPDGRSIAYFSGTPSVSSTLLLQDESVMAPVTLVGTASYKQFTDWSQDGRTLVFEERTPTTGWDLHAVSAQGRHETAPLLRTRFDERMGQLSPDGRFLAYVSNETGRSEVYVVRLPGASAKWPISNAGGTLPRWRRDGRELFFIGPDGRLMSVPTTADPAFQAGPANALSDLSTLQTDGWTYAVSARGDRFLVVQRSPDVAPTTLTVVLNWAAALAR